MKKIISDYSILFIIILYFGCGPSVSQFKMQQPEKGKCIVVGAILVENNGVDDYYEVHKSKITVIIVGKSIVNGEESVEGYRVKTDENGYFFLPNAPQGAYVVKGLELSLGYGGQTLISSRWDGARQIFHSASNMIDYVVRSWPEDVSGCVNDMGITYLMIDPSMGIYYNQYVELRDNVLSLENIKHTIENPVRYYRMKYPDIKCLNE